MSTATENWRREARCAQQPADPRWWDGHLDGETEAERAKRHEIAKAICARCPVSQQCRKAAVPRVDEGIRGGELMPAVRAPKAPKETAKTTPGREYKRLLAEGVSADVARLLAPVGARHANSQLLVRQALSQAVA